MSRGKLFALLMVYFGLGYGAGYLKAKNAVISIEVALKERKTKNE